jgi:hypothetical protein
MLVEVNLCGILLLVIKFSVLETEVSSCFEVWIDRGRPSSVLNKFKFHIYACLFSFSTQA